MKGFRILIIRPGAIGDALLAFPVLNALREHYAGAQMTLVSNAQVLPLALASGVVEQAFDFQDIWWSELFSTSGICTPIMHDLLEQTDLAICWLRDPDSIIERNLRNAGVKQCFIAPGRPPAGVRTHIVDYLAHTAGLPGVMAQFDVPLSLQPANPVFNGTTDKFIAIHPGSGAAQKCWPTSHFAAVIERLWQQNSSVLLLEGPADTGRISDLIRQLSSPPIPEMFKILNNEPLLQLAHHLQQCGCYLGNDSGITHLAAMLGIPTIAIFGPTDPAIWRPPGPCVKVIHGHALQDVSVDVAMEAIVSFSGYSTC